jgi:hypothetical protein
MRWFGLKNKKPDSVESGSAGWSFLRLSGGIYSLSACFHLHRAPVIDHARLTAASMAVVREWRGLEEQFTAGVDARSSVRQQAQILSRS